MNHNQTKAVLKVLNYLGIKSRLIKNQLSKAYHIGVVYNKSGDTIPFNPYTRLGDSMRIAMLMNMDVTFRPNEVFIRPSENATNDTCMTVYFDGDSEHKKVMRVGNAVVNCAIEIIKKDVYDEVS